MTTTTTLLSFRSDPDLKARLVADMRAHADADSLLQGAYWDTDLARGCAVGCTVADHLAAEQGVPAAAVDTDGVDWHAEWTRVTGLPQWLAHLDDWIFENLTPEVAREWPVRLLEAVPVGVDLTAARQMWLREVVFDPERGAMASAAAALDAAGLAPEAARLRGLSPSTDWDAAGDAARDAARAARDAGDAARDAGDAARDAARAARDAGDAARDAGPAVPGHQPGSVRLRDDELPPRLQRRRPQRRESFPDDQAPHPRVPQRHQVQPFQQAPRLAGTGGAGDARDAAGAARDAARAARVGWMADRLIHHLTTAAEK